MDRAAWWATVNAVAKSQTQLSRHACSISPGGSYNQPEASANSNRITDIEVFTELKYSLSVQG